MLRLVLFTLISWPLIASPISVLDSTFDNLDLEAMTRTLQKYKVKPPLTSEEKNEELLNLFFRAEQAYFARQPHAYQEGLKKAEELCDLYTLADENKKLKLSCALVYAELSKTAKAFSRMFYILKARSFLNESKTHADPSDLFYVEGRVLLSSTETVMPSVGKSILNFQLLLRARPEVLQTSFWIAYAYHLSGNTKAFGENLKIALKANNLRTKSMFGQNNHASRQFNDGVSYGSQFGLYADLLSGVGLIYRIWDDKILDQNRSAQILLNGSTGKNFGARINYTDEEIFLNYNMGIDTALAYVTDQYYGSGLNSHLNDKSIFRQQYWDTSLNFTRELSSNIYLSVGWAFHQRHLLELVEGPFATYPLLSGENVFYSGGYFVALLDLLDSTDFSLSGARVSLKGFFPTQDLLSKSTFQKWNFNSEIQYGFFGFHTKVIASSAKATVDSPFDALVEAKSDLDLPGIRHSRYRDFHITGSALEVKHKLFGPFVLGGYTTGLLSAFDFSTTRFGFGGFLEVYLSSFKKKQARFEMGSFNNEFIFALDLGFAL